MFNSVYYISDPGIQLFLTFNYYICCKEFAKLVTPTFIFKSNQIYYIGDPDINFFSTFIYIFAAKKLPNSWNQIFHIRDPIIQHFFTLNYILTRNLPNWWPQHSILHRIKSNLPYCFLFQLLIIFFARILPNWWHPHSIFNQI